MIRKSDLMVKLEESNRERAILEDEIQEQFDELCKPENNPDRSALLNGLGMLH